jgi:glucose/mannose transport system substrate-binding protein
MLEPETQIRFSQKKGSIPVRLDLDVSSLDTCAQKAVKFLADKSHQVPAQELLSPPALTGAMEDVISQYWNTPSMTADTFVTKVAGVLKEPY